MCECDEVRCGIGHVDKVKESSVDPSRGNRDVASPKDDTADKCLQNCRKFVFQCFLQSLEIVTASMKKVPVWEIILSFSGHGGNDVF